MASDLPKIEGLINVTTAYVISVTDVGGTDAAITIPVDEYYLTSTRETVLLTTLQTALNASATLTGTFTVTLDDDTYAATGKVTIASTHAFTVSWTSTTLRDILGWTGDIASTTSATGQNHATHLWLPTCNRTGSVPDPVAASSYFGKPRTDVTTTMAPSGQYTSQYYNTLHQAVLDFQTLNGAKTWQRLETYTNESLEKFYRSVIGQGLRFAYFPDRSDNAYSWQLWTPTGAMLNANSIDPSYVGSGSIWSWGIEVMDYVA